MNEPVRNRDEPRARDAATPSGGAPPLRWSTEQVEQSVGNLLRVGVMFAAAVTALGGIALLLQYGGAQADYHVFRGEPAELRTMSGIITAALHLESRAVVQLGIVLLIATPAARVLLTFVAFLLQGDRLYTAITAMVLGVLLFSLFLGGAA